LVTHIHIHIPQKDKYFKVAGFEVLTAVVGLYFDPEDGGDMFLRNVL
jgi:hypothetical protein